VERPPTSGNTALFDSLNGAYSGATGCSFAIGIPPEFHVGTSQSHRNKFAGVFAKMQRSSGARI
jgi:hypothetical protein